MNKGKRKVQAALRQGGKRCVSAREAGIIFHGDYYEGYKAPLRLRRLWWRNFRNYLVRQRDGRMLRAYGLWKWRTQRTRDRGDE